MDQPLKAFALVYDFDGTLARGNIQECSFIPGVAHMATAAFWNEVKHVAREHDADEILTYMLVMLQNARQRGSPIRKDDLQWHGTAARLFPGLAGSNNWFSRIGEFGKIHGYDVQHYVVSSGIEEMIRGCPIADQFTDVYASRFIYDESGEALWPGNAINYTNKTQYLFRINKGVTNVWNNEAVNRWMPEDERPVPFRRLIFLGDGDTDIPSMKMTAHMGGHSIAVYDDSPEEQERGRNQDKLHKLIAEDRVNFVAPADYREGQLMELLVKGIIGRVAQREGIRPPAEASQ